MSGLMYREDMDEARQRLTTWWNGGDIGRPAMQITAPRPKHIEDIPGMPTPEGWITGYSIKNFDFRLNCALRAGIATYFLAEAAPAVSPDLAPNTLALFLGCPGIEVSGSVWCDPIFDKPEDARFVFDKQNKYWQFCERLTREQLRLGGTKFLTAFPDLIEGLDTLAAAYGTDKLLFALVERPEWVHDCLRQITDRYFQCYDILYDLIRDEVGGTHFWAWAPGRMAKFQCDFSAMISPEMFGEFMVPVLTEMAERVGYCMYHWDGPGAIPHHDHLLSIPKLTMLQWTPGAGEPDTPDPKWWPLYHKTVEAGKTVIVSCHSVEDLKAFKREFGEKLKRFMINMGAESPEQAEELMKIAEV